jgi:hypothetical protein
MKYIIETGSGDMIYKFYNNEFWNSEIFKGIHILTHREQGDKVIS